MALPFKSLSEFHPLGTVLLNNTSLESKLNNFVKLAFVLLWFCWSKIGKSVVHRLSVFSYSILNVIYSLRVPYTCIMGCDHIYFLTPHPTSPKHSPPHPLNFIFPLRLFSLYTHWVQLLLPICTDVKTIHWCINHLQEDTMTDRGQKISFWRTLLIMKSDLLHLFKSKITPILRTFPHNVELLFFR